MAFEPGWSPRKVGFATGLAGNARRSQDTPRWPVYGNTIVKQRPAVGGLPSFVTFDSHAEKVQAARRLGGAGNHLQVRRDRAGRIAGLS